MLASGAVALLLAVAGSPQDTVQPSYRQAVQRFKYEFHRPGARDDDRIRALNRVAQYRHKEVVKILAGHVSRGSLSVRIVATRQLRNLRGVEGAPEALVRAFRANSSSHRKSVRIEAIRGLGELQVREAAGTINRLVADRNDWIAKAAIDAAGNIRDRSSIEPLIKQLRKIEGPAGNGLIEVNPLFREIPDLSLIGIIGREIYQARRPSPRDFLRAPINQALSDITRQSFTHAHLWQEWWRKNKSTFRVPD